MPISFRCPDGHKLSVPDSLAGRKARCPKCRRKMYIPPDNSDPNRFAQPAPEEVAAVEQTSASLSTLAVPTSGEVDPAADVNLTEDESDVAIPALDAPQEIRTPILPTVYQASPDKVQTVRLLTIALALSALFTAGPVVFYHNLFAAPDWVRLVLLLSVVQLAFVAWLASLPDWVSVWVVMLVNALVATAYGAALAIFLYTPVESPLGLGLANVSRRTAAGWCLCVVLIASMMAFVCGRVCASWRRADEWKRRKSSEWSVVSSQ